MRRPPPDEAGDAIEYAAILKQWERGESVDTMDLLNALQWRCRNQSRELAKLHRLRHEERWQPVETAPPGQKWVLLWWASITDCAIVGYRGTDGRWRSPLLSFDGYIEAEGGIGSPTHWKPMPVRPDAADEAPSSVSMGGQPMGDPHPCDLVRHGQHPITGKPLPSNTRNVPALLDVELGRRESAPARHVAELANQNSVAMQAERDRLRAALDKVLPWLDLIAGTHGTECANPRYYGKHVAEVLREALSPSGIRPDASELIAFLDSLAKIDPTAIGALIAARVPCNESLAKHPTVQSGPRDGGGYEVGFLGVVNGYAGAYTDEPNKGWGPVAAVVEKDGSCTAFVETRGADLKADPKDCSCAGVDRTDGLHESSCVSQTKADDGPCVHGNLKSECRKCGAGLKVNEEDGGTRD